MIEIRRLITGHAQAVALKAPPLALRLIRTVC
jgi:hypothetical protein